MEVKVICWAVVEKDGKILLVQEKKEHCKGKWNYPAGRLDLDEDIFSAAVREVKEETGLDVELEGLIGIYQHKSIRGNCIVMIHFKASVIGGEMKHNEDELLDVRWFTPEEMRKLDLRSGDITQDIRGLEEEGTAPA
ncbi:MAG: NUDIX domain-containing protein [Nanoarchaeota archaeon]|nr:NUDIX domain-containing protein [Nanoarchaeota archaeon]